MLTMNAHHLRDMFLVVAHGSLIHDGTQMCMPEDFKQMMELISVREI